MVEEIWVTSVFSLSLISSGWHTSSNVMSVQTFNINQTYLTVFINDDSAKLVCQQQMISFKK